MYLTAYVTARVTLAVAARVATRATTRIAARATTRVTVRLIARSTTRVAADLIMYNENHENNSGHYNYKSIHNFLPVLLYIRTSYGSVNMSGTLI